MGTRSVTHVLTTLKGTECKHSIAPCNDDTMNVERTQHEAISTNEAINVHQRQHKTLRGTGCEFENADTVDASPSALCGKRRTNIPQQDNLPVQVGAHRNVGRSQRVELGHGGVTADQFLRRVRTVVSRQGTHTCRTQQPKTLT